jgi:hypothetical protein
LEPDVDPVNDKDCRRQSNECHNGLVRARHSHHLGESIRVRAGEILLEGNNWFIASRNGRSFHSLLLQQKKLIV